MTMREALAATLKPLRRPSTLGMNLNRRKDLKMRSARRDSRMLVARSKSRKQFIRDGMATTVRIKSKRFQPSFQ